MNLYYLKFYLFYANSIDEITTIPNCQSPNKLQMLRHVAKLANNRHYGDGGIGGLGCRVFWRWGGWAVDWVGSRTGHVDYTKIGTMAAGEKG